MKFLCVACDLPMRLSSTSGPERGSMTVIFACPGCGARTAMLTNASETQVVRSLGVKIGGRTVDAEPMEGIRTGLSPDRKAAPGMGCPFTGMVNEAYRQRDGLPWTDEARGRMENIPSSARAMVMQSIERFAREEGYAEIDAVVLDRARSRMGT